MPAPPLPPPVTPGNAGLLAGPGLACSAEEARQAAYGTRGFHASRHQRKGMTSLVIGLILGIVGSLIAWYMTVGIITPALDIRDDMELIRRIGQPDEYRFAVRNRRIFRHAQDVSIRVQCSYLSHARGVTGERMRKFFDIPVDDDWIPMIRSRWYWRRHRPEGRTKSDPWPQKPTLFPGDISGPSKLTVVVLLRGYFSWCCADGLWSCAWCPVCRRCGRVGAGWRGCGSRRRGGLRAWRAG